MVTWNTQALFALDPFLHKEKSKKVHQFMATHDIGCCTETHGTPDRDKLWKNPPGCQTWWAPGPSTGTAGVGIMVRDDFLAQFEMKAQFEIIFPGRAAVLHLVGKAGSLDIYSVYFQTGGSTPPADICAAGFDPHGRSISTFELRESLRRRLALKIRSKDQSLTLMGGDFNYATDAHDRMCTSSASYTEARDSRDATNWRTHLEARFGLHELFQPEPTNAAPGSRSRIDRIYSSQYHTEYCDKAFSCTALNWCPLLSRHRPLSLRKCIPEHNDQRTRPIPEHILDNPDWARQAASSWQELLTAYPDASAITKLKLIKKAMREAAKSIGCKTEALPPPETLEDRIGVSMQFLRAAEAA